MKSSPVAAITLVVANLIPLAGLFFLDWTLYTLAMLYWWECAFIGIFTIAKMGCATRVGPVGKTKAYKILLFLAHYCTAWVFYWAFLSNILFPETARSLSRDVLFYVCLFLFFISHGVSFGLNYLKRREYTKTSTLQQMFMPYRRLWIVHLLFVIVVFIVLKTNASSLAVFAVIALKTVVDLVVHRMGHAQLADIQAPRPAAAQSPIH